MAGRLKSWYTTGVPNVTEHPQSRGEEIANSISHGLAVIAVLISAPFLILHALRFGTAWDIVGASIFIGCASLLYLGSTLYHAIPHPRARRVFHILDHSGIFLLIAGTYTPFTLGVLRGAWGWPIFFSIWLLAIGGIVLKSVGKLSNRHWSNALYVTMGLLVMVAAKPLWVNASPWVILWLGAGGVAYIGGIAFYNTRRLRYGHFLWHLCVMAGTVLHYIAVLKFA
ncbi:MAG: hemolysin III family protein [Candidatus Kerfeldbacteria bacterium]|nr:hemolysin III family protein [Candidatus Kerfeldbacteria bacterium]